MSSQKGLAVSVDTVAPISISRLTVVGVFAAANRFTIFLQVTPDDQFFARGDQP